MSDEPVTTATQAAPASDEPVDAATVKPWEPQPLLPTTEVRELYSATTEQTDTFTLEQIDQALAAGKTVRVRIDETPQEVLQRELIIGGEAAKAAGLTDHPTFQEPHAFWASPQTPKSLNASDANPVEQVVPDVETYGNPHAFKLLFKAYSQEQGWMKSTKALEIERLGCLVQVTTQQRNPDGSYAVAEAITFVPGVVVEDIHELGKCVVGRKLALAYH